MISKEQFSKILLPTKYSDDFIISVVDALNQTFTKYEINTPLRQSHFIAQLLHETMNLHYFKEIWGPTEVQKGYEGDKDLGNTEPGDGLRFLGRGGFQITGRYNYVKVAKDLVIDCVNHPEILQSLPYAIIVAGWFWDLRHLNEIADTDNVSLVTKKINGGYTGLKERTMNLVKCKTVLL